MTREPSESDDVPTKVQHTKNWTRAAEWVGALCRRPVRVPLVALIIGALALVVATWGAARLFPTSRAIPQDVRGTISGVTADGVGITFRPDDPGDVTHKGGFLLGAGEWVDRDGHDHDRDRPTCAQPGSTSEHRVILSFVDVVSSMKSTPVVVLIRCLD
jgi:hypothetical protein